MELKVFFTVFTAVFIAELGDKTQLATMLFAADGEVNKWTGFWGASAALVVASAIGVLAGHLCQSSSTNGISITLLEQDSFSLERSHWYAPKAPLRHHLFLQRAIASFFKISFCCVAAGALVSAEDF